MLMAVNGPYVLTVQHDDFFPNPRRDGESFGTMTCFHRRYQIGDEHKYFCSDDLLEDLFIKAAGGGEKGKQKYDALMDSFDLHPGTTEQLRALSRALMAEIEKAYVVLPVYALDHGGLSVSTKSFNDPWDSGQTGIIYASYDKIREEFDVEKVTPEIRLQVENMLNAEVEAYNDYLHGECYGFELYKDGELQDSCWGFIGSIDKACQDIADYLPDNCKAMTSKLSEVTEPASLIKVLMKHARIQVEQAVKDHEHQPRQKSLDAILS